MSTPHIVDNHGRPINYVRLAITDRCNLRCFYCMPEEGIQYIPRESLLSFEELIRLMGILSTLGIDKVRITGGEPFLRKDLIKFLEQLVKIEGINTVSMTSNGTIIQKHLDDLWHLGIRNINLSLDSLDRDRFFKITRRDDFKWVMETFEQMLDMGFNLKINAVVMKNRNIEDIIPLVEMTREKKIAIRFIEEMPFNGAENKSAEELWNYRDILDHITDHFPNLTKLHSPASSTAIRFQIPEFVGEVGIIPAYSRTFCGGCNRIRITPAGLLKTCLYDKGIFNVKDLMRAGATDNDIAAAVIDACKNRAKDGFEAEEQSRNHTFFESMSTIGG